MNYSKEVDLRKKQGGWVYFFELLLYWYGWLAKLEKKSSVPVDCAGINPDLLRPEPAPIALPMEYEARGPLSLSSEPSLSAPTTPTSASETFLAAKLSKEYIMRKAFVLL